MKRKKIVIAGLAALAAAATIGGTWAVWTQQQMAHNEFMTARYSTFLREEFTPQEGWLPGEARPKRAYVENDSTIPIIAKITLNQRWVRANDIAAHTDPDNPDSQIIARQNERLPITFGEGRDKEFAAILNFNKEAVAVLSQGRNQVPGMRLDIPEVSDMKSAEGRWLLLSETPDQDGNFTFYYMGLVAPGERTPSLLSGVTMNPRLEATVTGSHTYFVKDDTAALSGYRKVMVDTVNGQCGYDSSTFTLNVNMQTVQATKGAVLSIFHSDPVSQYIAANLAEEAVYEAVDPVKTLSFKQTDGVMTYEPYRMPNGDIEGGNWFMSFTNMVPGGVYKDKLHIENNNSRDFRLFMKIVPKSGEEAQSQLQEELLRKISMKVYYADQLIYDGDATGYHYSDGNGSQDMQGTVPLGIYFPGRKEEIRVELTLDPNLELNPDGTSDYDNILTKIDWEFMAQEVEREPDRPNRPGGDDDNGGGGDDYYEPSGGGTTAIPDEAVPLDGLTIIDDAGVPLTILPDMEVPLAFMVPQTGDEFPFVPVIVTLAASLAMIMVFGILGFGKKKETKA